MAKSIIYPYKFSIEKTHTSGSKEERLFCFSETDNFDKDVRHINLANILNTLLNDSLSTQFDFVSRETTLVNQDLEIGTKNIVSKQIKSGNIKIAEHLFGELYIGYYGEAAKIYKKTGEFVISKSEDETVAAPLAFNILLPYGYNEGIAIFENNSGKNLKPALEAYLNTMLGIADDKFRILFLNFAPKEAIKSSISRGDLKSIRTIKTYKPNTDNDTNLANNGVLSKIINSGSEDNQFLYHEQETIYKLSDHGKDVISNLITSKLNNVTLLSEILVFGDIEEVDSVKLDYDYNGSRKVLNLEKGTKFKCSRDVINVVNKSSKPNNTLVQEESEKMMYEFAGYMGFNRE